MEADSNAMTECPHDDKPSTGMFAVFSPFISLCTSHHTKHVWCLCDCLYIILYYILYS